MQLSDDDLAAGEAPGRGRDLRARPALHRGRRCAGASGSHRSAQELGDAFIGVEIDSSEGNPWGISKRAHSVLTEHLVDEPGHPTREALDQVLEFFRTRLLEPAP